MSDLDDAQFPLDPAKQEKLLSSQNECTFIWNTREGWPVGATMGYLWQDGKLWMTCGGERPRVRAVRRNDQGLRGGLRAAPEQRQCRGYDQGTLPCPR